MADDDFIGRQFGNYRLIRLLGEGSFAQVYLGQHIHIHTQAAIKILGTKLSDDDIALFRNEARAFAGLKHTYIVQMLDFGVEGRLPYIAMEYAPNGTLRQRHPKGTQLPLATILIYVKQIAAALQYAHDQRLIHRDIKPENILLGQHNEVLLSDFGIALEAQTTYQQQTGSFSGTAAYSAPEQLQGKPRPASDQYALAVMVYEWLCGDRPFHGSSLEIASQHVLASPAPLYERVPDLPPVVEQVVMIALAKDPHQRFASVTAFANALEQASQPVPAWAATPTVPAAAPSLPTTQAAASVDPSITPTLPAEAGPDEITPPPTDADHSATAAAPALAEVSPPPRATPPRKSKTGLSVLVVLVVLAVIGGGIGTALIINARTHPSQNNGRSGSSGTSSVPSGYQVFTNSDQTFSIAYPSDWAQSATQYGTGEDFNGPSNQVFKVANDGSQNYTPTQFDDNVCTSGNGFNGFSGKANPTQTVSIGGQDWTQEECDSGDGATHAVIETIIYQDNLYYIVYYSPRDTFDSDRDTFFSSIEQSFTFLT